MNRVYRTGSGVPRPRTITDRTVAGAYLPGTFVFIGATTLTQAAAPTGGRLAILGDRDYYAAGGVTLSTDPLLTPYASGESGVAYLPKPDDEFACAMAAGTYTTGQELTVAASGRLAAAVATNVVVAHFDQPGAVLTAGQLADVVIANAYTKA